MSAVRGRGLFCAFDLPTTEERDRLVARAYGNGLLLLGCGPRTVRFRPALSLTEAEADLVVERVAASF